MKDGELFERVEELGPKQGSTVLLLERAMHWCANANSNNFNQIAVSKTFCPTMGRHVRLHFAPGVDHSTTCMIYFAIGDEIYPSMYAIFGDEWEHDSGDESDSSFTLF